MHTHTHVHIIVHTITNTHRDDASLDSLSDGEEGGSNEQGGTERERLLEMPQNGHHQNGRQPDKAPSFSEKLRWMFGSVHVLLFLAQAILFGYGFGELGIYCLRGVRKEACSAWLSEVDGSLHVCSQTHSSH